MAATTTAAFMSSAIPGQHLSREAAVLLRRHLDFQRLLVATEAAAGRHRELLGRLERGVEDGDGERQCQLELNRLLVFARALREQLTELSGLADYSLGSGIGSADVSPKVLQGYGFRVDALERGLLTRQQEMRRLKAKAAAAAATAATAIATTAAADQLQQQQPRTPSSSTTKGGKVGGRVVGREDEPKLDKESQERVKKEQEAQHALKAQLEELVGALKQSSLVVHSSLREQNKVLDKTDDAAQRNLEGLQSELRKTEEQLRRSWSNSLTSCVMIVLMLGIFIATFLFMRLFPKRRWLLW